MTKRRAITLSTKVAVLQAQAVCGCGCGRSLKDQPIEWDHALAHALGGSDGPENIRAVLKDCHDFITNGTHATTAGSTKQVVAKVKRIAATRVKVGTPGYIEDGFFHPIEEQRQAIRKRKIPSRGFPKPPPGYAHQWPKGRKVGR